jgi:hypothetical protein
MKTLKYLLSLVIFFTVVSIYSQNEHEGEKVEGKELADGTLYGTDINSSTPVIQVKDIFADLSSYEGKTIVVEGTISEVCKVGGCWTVVTDGQNYIRALTQHKFIIPKDMDVSKNYKAQIEGEFAVKEITEEQAKHFAEESGKPTDGIVGPQKMYRIKATGIKILK